MLTSAIIKGFTEAVLAARYDSPKPVPTFHVELWDLCCSERPYVAIAAPRKHAKSTAVTGAYVLASALFRQSRHILVLSANEEMAAQFVNDLRIEIGENEVLRQEFGVKKFLKEAETELIVELEGGYRFRIIAKGAGQRMRGLKWDRMRPDLVIGDDMEDDETVMNSDRRTKFKRWFYGAVLPIIGDTGKIRIVGTIMHMDSLLENFMPQATDERTVVEELKIYREGEISPLEWVGVKYRAHNPEFTHILWPEQFPKERLMAIRSDYSERGLLDVYSQEYLNDPIDEENAYFKETWFRESPDTDFWRKRSVNFYAAADLAISTGRNTDYTAIVVAAVDENGNLELVHARRGRWDSHEIVQNMFEVNKHYKLTSFTLEKGALEKSIGAYLNSEMRRQQKYINMIKIPSVRAKTDKTRAGSIQGRMKVGDVYFRKDLDWFPDFQEEMLRFPRGKHDDYVDAFSLIGQTLENMTEAPTQEELREEFRNEIHDEQAHLLREYGHGGQSKWGGY